MSADDFVVGRQGVAGRPPASRAVRASRRAARVHAVGATGLLAAALAAVLAVALSAGEFAVPLGDVIAAVAGQGDGGAAYIVNELRLPRALTGILVGASLGMSGAIHQSILRNPLGSPDVLGMTAGGSLAAIFAITVASASFATIALAAFAGSMAFAALVYAVAYRQGVSSQRFILVGIGLAGAAIAATQFLVTEASRLESAEMLLWLTGSLNAVGRETLVPLAITFAVLAPLAVALTPRLHALALSDDTATALGVRVEAARLAAIAVGAGLCGIGIAAAGPVMFVAFMAAPIARRLTRSVLALIPAGIAGALIVLGADQLGRLAFAPAEIPVGIFTGAAGAPFLLFLLARSNLEGRGG
jgi:iron complex transport system permease protein